MKKSLVSVILVFVMLFTLAVPAFAAVEGKLSADVTTSADGKTATVTLSVNNNSGFIALQVKATYDDKALRLTSAKNGSVFDSIYSTSQKLTDTPYQIIFMDAFAEEDIKTNGVLVTYTFDILKASGSDVTFEVVDAANSKHESKFNFNTCTVKIGNGEAESEPTGTTASSNASNGAVDKNETVLDGSNDGAQTPDSNQSGEENSGNDNFDTTTDDQQTATDTPTDIDELADTKNPATTIIIVVAALVLVGLAVFGGIYLKKRRG